VRPKQAGNGRRKDVSDRAVVRLHVVMPGQAAYDNMEAKNMHNWVHWLEIALHLALIVCILLRATGIVH
jgi:hypothetical protein